MGMTMNVWNRSGEDSISRRAFYFLIGAILFEGFTLNYYISRATMNWHPSGVSSLLAIGFGLPLIGILISNFSKNPLISFLGFNMTVGGLSAILGPVLSNYAKLQPGIISEAMALTACVTVVMTISGALFPNFYSKLGGALFAALSSLLIVRILGLFIPSLNNFGFIEYLGAGLFALYIGYDMWRASEIPATLDNAVDISVSLYLDIINLFLEILKVLSKEKD